MTNEIIELLEEEDHPEKIQELLEEAVDMLNRSRAEIAKNYCSWDKGLEVYRRKRNTDTADVRAKQKAEPVKMTVPLTYAQVNTLVTFLFISLTSKESIFELAATGDEDHPIREVSQQVIDREVRQTNFHMRLVEALLDMARFSLGVLKTSWNYESIFVQPKAEAELDLSFIFDETNLIAPQMEDIEEEEVILKEGCKIENVSPYHFFYDTRVPITRWKEGRFAADEQSVNYKDLQRAEKQGRYAGVKYVNDFDSNLWSNRGGKATNRLEGVEPNGVSLKDKKNKMCAVTSIQIKLIPSEYELGDSDDEEIWIVTYVNDNRIIGLEPLNSPTQEFQYDIIQMLPDQHADLCDSLSKLIDPIQEVISWLINARVSSVRRNIDGRLIVDQQHVDMSTLNTTSPFILLKKSAPRMGVSRFIEQLRTTDPTASHFNDVESLIRVLYMVSGVNENSMGAFAPGRRSATENRTANAGASARMKLIAACCWQGGLQSLGRKLLLSCRQDLSLQTFKKIVGDRKGEETYPLFHPENSWELYGNEDFFAYDATVESERNYIAQSLQEMLLGLIQNPEMAAAMQLDLPAMMKESFALRGLKNLSRFELQAPATPILSPALPGAPVPPETPLV